MATDYKFLNFFYQLGGGIVPLKRVKGQRIPAVKWGEDTFLIPKDELIRDYPFEQYNYSFKLPESMAVIDVESHKGGLEELGKLKEELGIDLFSTYYHTTGRGGIHAFYKVNKAQQKKIAKGYLRGYKGIEILYGKNVLVPIPPSTHYETGKPYTVGPHTQAKKNFKPLPKTIIDYMDHTAVDARGRDEGAPSPASQIDNLEHCLRYLDPKNFGDYGEWVKILFSAYDFVKGDKKGLTIFIDWCKQDDKYKEDDKKIRTLWNKVKKIKQNKDDPRNLVTYKTIMYHALKAGCKIKINIGKLVDEIFNNSFEFISTLENDGEYVRDIAEGRDIFDKALKENIGNERWARLTTGVIARIQGFVFDNSGIMKRDFIEMRIKDLIERNRISLFKRAWDEVNFKCRSTATSIDDLVHTPKLFFELLSHTDEKYAKDVYPFFVKYLVSGHRANLEQYDEKYRSNSQTCLCIVSENQGIGKSTFARALTPCPDMIYYPSLRNIREGETKLAISRASMCIIDDYQPSYQKELNNLNEILTQNTIMVRPKYGRIEIPKTRRAFFALTTNFKKILNDYSGSRRWINIDLNGMNIAKVLDIMPLVQGEIMALAESGLQHWFDLDEIQKLEFLNKKFSGVETIDEIIINHYAADQEISTEDAPTASEIMRQINNNYGQNTIRDMRQIGFAIKRLFPDAGTRRPRRDGHQVKCYELKLVKAFKNELVTEY